MPKMKMSDGCELYYTWDGDENKPVLMFSCPLGFTHTVWDAQVAELATDFRILRYDARGHGQSDVTCEAYTIESLSQDVQELIKGLGLPPIAFCGLSIGGMVGIYLAKNNPDLFTHVVLANTSAYLGTAPPLEQRLKIVKEQGMAAVADDVISRSLSQNYRMANPQETERITNMLTSISPAGYIAGGQAVLSMDLRGIASDIALPVLVIAGTQDTATPAEMGKALSTSIHHAGFSILDSAHLSNVEQSQQFNHLLTEFIRR